jgi:hypothetical protein
LPSGEKLAWGLEDGRGLLRGAEPPSPGKHPASRTMVTSAAAAIPTAALVRETCMKGLLCQNTFLKQAYSEQRKLSIGP